MKTTTMTLDQIAARQARYVHLCELLGVQDRPDSGDGYTAADHERSRADAYAAEDARMQRRGF
jgi:hypothetical protein